MSKKQIVIGAAASLLLCGPVLADMALAQAKGCMACHQVDAKLVGPSYKDVAAKYQGDANAKAMLIGKVRNGGVGAWGEIMMPPNTTASDAELDTLITWVLAR